jgi:O-antigen/teichoic acid export membrane protein
VGLLGVATHGVETSLKNNVIANALGQSWRALIQIVLVPLYVGYLGIEAYGLIGLFAVLQAWLTLLDMGMKPALGREMARYTGGGHDTQSICNLLRSIELISFGIGLVVAVCVWAASGWLAADWVQAATLSPDVVRQSLALMGLATGLQFFESVYTSSIAGLQRHVLQNVLSSTLVTLRSVGALAVLVLVSPTLTAFFFWQALVSILSIGVFAGVTYRLLPAPPTRPRFSVTAVLSIWRYAAGIMSITLLALLLTQVDKILLSRLLPLADFGYYAFAALVAGGLNALTSPIAGAFYPRFTQLVMQGDQDQLSLKYHQGSQLVSVLVGGVAAILVMFADRVLMLWTGDATLTRAVVPVLQVLTLGTLLNSLMWMPYHLQLAHGWTRLMIKINAVAVAVLVPAILWAVPVYGAIGAAWVWVVLNAGYIIFTIYFMHRQILVTERWRWYLLDVAQPVGVMFLVAAAFQLGAPIRLSAIYEIGFLSFVAGAVLGCGVLAAPLARDQVEGLLPRVVRDKLQQLRDKVRGR